MLLCSSFMVLSTALNSFIIISFSSDALSIKFVSLTTFTHKNMGILDGGLDTRDEASKEDNSSKSSQHRTEGNEAKNMHFPPMHLIACC